MTYNLHIIVRFELEQAMLAGDLPVGDLPAAWNQKYRETLGISPRTTPRAASRTSTGAPGCSAISRPTRWATFTRPSSLPGPAPICAGLDQAFARGEFAELLSWLRDSIHRHGQRHRPGPLIERATGASPDPHALVAALKHKYGELYGL